MMILAGVFAVPNAAIVLILRSGLIPGTPAQVRDWTMKAFLAVNPSVAIFLAEVILHPWLRGLHLHQITGGLPPSRLKSICRSVERRIAWEGACPLERRPAHRLHRVASDAAHRVRLVDSPPGPLPRHRPV